MLKLDIFTLFPEWFSWFAAQRHVRNAIDADALALRALDMRATTPLRGGRVDDTPYGGGAGMVIRVDVVSAALESAYGPSVEPTFKDTRIVLLTPTGRPFDESLAREFADESRIALLSGRYEGFDERVGTELADDAVSIGPYVLSGGELPAMVVADATVRKLPGALGDAESARVDSFTEALEGAPEYPQYTRPQSWRGSEVPRVLLSGDHRRIAEWRTAESRRRGDPRRSSVG